MKKIILLIALCIANIVIFAHNSNYEKVALHHWHLKNQKQVIEGSFTMLKNNLVYIEDANQKICAFPMSLLTKTDQQFAIKKYANIAKLNEQLVSNANNSNVSEPLFNQKIGIVFVFILALSFFTFIYTDKAKRKFIIPVLLVSTSTALLSFSIKVVKSLRSISDPLAIDSAFSPFKPVINTFWDSNYFYVESKGIPATHEMMVGISNHGWQQQVPIPQCYIGANAWPIPLNPTIAATPIPVDTIHFTRGAIAIAVNGVPIFNVHTNTGVDSYVDGQLDNFGGHCGRADDYHYHTAPLHLYSYTAANKPIAYGLDGFAVYGNVEPDGNAMLTLDANHGHSFNGVYHYHGTQSAPYMIAKMVGNVTEDASHQLIPQAAAHPVRQALTPLNGAVITSCTSNSSNNGYNLTYTRSGFIDSVVYNWTNNGQYTFKYYNNGVLDSTKIVNNGFIQCTVPVISSLSNDYVKQAEAFIFPNPNNGNFQLKLSTVLQGKKVNKIAIYSIKGELIFEANNYQSPMEFNNLNNGLYLLHLDFTDGNSINQKFIVH